MIVMNEKHLKSGLLLVIAVTSLLALGFLASGGRILNVAADNKATPDMDVEIEVWDSENETWVKEVALPVLSEARFRIYVHNVGDYDLFNISIVNHLPPFLEYVGNSSSPYEPQSATNNTITWKVSSLFHCCGGEAFEDFYVVNVTKAGFGTSNIEVTAYFLQKGKIIKTDLVTIRAFYDTNPPYVEIIRPKPGIYLMDRRIMPLLRQTILIGESSIETETFDRELSVERVEIYIDDNMVANISEPPYIYKWKERGFGRYTIKVISYDTAGNHAEDSIAVWKIF
ncbi:MAG: hypothetical protein FE037_04370 [Thermoplasmata archaeon]|nr:MAG: hypothetical protein FE037_04370 [Thermoplasmata archaeon]